MEFDARNKEIEELKAAGKLVFCMACGEPNSTDDAFCGKCGARIASPQGTQSQTYQSTQEQSYRDTNANYQSQSSNYGYYNNANAGASDELNPEVLRMVRDNVEYYEPKFRLMKATNKKTSWNWPAFLVPSFWLFYRRMYVYGIIFIVGTSILGAVSALVLPILANIALGVFGNYIYMNFLEKTISDANNLQEPYRSQNIASRTGANPTAVWIAIGIYFALGIIATIALGGLFALSGGLY